MKKLLIASHHFNCQGIQSINNETSPRLDSVTVPVIVNAFRNGMMDVLCPSLAKFGICSLESDPFRKTLCIYYKTPPGDKKSQTPDEDILNKSAAF